MNADQRVRRLHELREKWLEGEVFLALALLEEEQLELHKEFGYMTFTRFLEREGLMKPGRYADFKKALTTLGRDRIDPAIGLDANIQASRVPNVEHQDEILSSSRDFLDINGHAPSADSARTIRNDVDPKPRVPLVTQKARARQATEDELTKLRRQNQELRRQLLVVTKERDDLATELERIKSVSTASKPPKPGRSGTHP